LMIASTLGTARKPTTTARQQHIAMIRGEN
jgi:hypothetical protein